MTLRSILCASISILAAASPARASPNLSLDDPINEQLAALRALGRLPAYLGGWRPLTEVRAHRLLLDAGSESGLDPVTGARWWVSPLRRVAGRLSLVRDEKRPTSTTARPRDITGFVAVSCEHQEGRPCGDGTGWVTELDSAAGYGPWASGAVRLRAQVGTDGYEADVELDRGYLNAKLGPVAFEVGRDVFALGPSSRTQLGWGDNAPSLDHVRLSTSQPYDLAGQRGDWLRGSLAQVVGRLRAPQTYTGNVVSISRAQLDVGDTVEVGAMQLLQLGGEGAPSFGPWDFILEHVRRRDLSATATDSSNRRVGADVAVRVARLQGARLYYQLMFEDLRRRVGSALRFDADHLVGLELAGLCGGRHAVVVEWQKTGVRSHEHVPRTTGLTNAGRIVGSPLGPDAHALFGGGRIDLGWSTLSPWLEIARLSSDTYTFVTDGPISRATAGVAEHRYRAGLRLRLPLPRGLRLEAETLVEQVDAAGFDPEAERANAGVSAALVWHPDGPLGRLP